MTTSAHWDGSYESQGQVVTWGAGRISGWFDGHYYLEVENPDGSTLRADPGAIILRNADGGFRVLADA